MGWIDRLIDVLGLPIVRRVRSARREAARRFIRSPEAKSTPLHDFEEKFGITGVDGNSKLQGYPKSELYKSEDPKKVEHAKKVADEFVGQR